MTSTCVISTLSPTEAPSLSGADQCDDPQRTNSQIEAPGAEARDEALSEDDLLLRRIAGGDEAAFRLLVTKHIDRAFAVALRFLGNRADAEDVVQDSFLKIWSHRGHWIENRAKFSTWLYRVVTNRCIDLSRRPRSEDVESFSELTDNKPDAVTLIHRDEVSDILDRAIRQLPDQQRVAVLMSYHENLSNSEIAELMGTTVSAVESLLKRGRQQLRSLLRRSERDIRQTFEDA
ncbi:MAG TPA: RNA polymerase sigma factor [Bradyrhizobium sp.]|nr:RNA polymerase sigma factor [Bradyrhizobium sp.]